MGNWSAILPEATTNYIENPSFEAATLTDDWTNSSLTTFENSTTRAKFGAQSLHAISDNLNDLAYSNTVAEADATETWTASCWVWVVSGDFKLTIQENNAGWTDKANSTTSTTGKWVYVTVSATLTAGVTDARIKVGPSATAASEFYIDGCQLENKSYATTFCDGEQAGCVWNGTKHASTSTRSSQERSGGRVIDIDDTYSVKTTLASGIGMPPIRHNITDYAILPGANFQSTKVLPRPFVLTFGVGGSSLANLHSKRDSLIEVFKADRVSPTQPVRLRYAGAGTDVEIDAHYDGGLEAEIGRGTFERMAARFVAYDPFWYGLGEAAKALTTKASVANSRYFAQRIDGTWSGLSGPNDRIYSVAVGPDACIYLAGEFINVGDANGDYIVKYDPVAAAFTSLAGPPGALIYKILFGPDGKLYAGGQFTNLGGASGDFVAYWDGSAWNAMGTGMSALGYVWDMAFGPDGKLYVVGEFASAGGVANTAFVAYWDGSAWNAMGTGLDLYAYAVGVGRDGKVYVGGAFANAGGSAATRAAYWDGSAWNAMGTGMNGLVYSIDVADDGSVYYGGDFTTAGGVTVNRAAKWNGVQWSDLASGVSGGAGPTVRMVKAVANLLYVSGAFAQAGSITTPDSTAIWNGASWAHLDFSPGTTGVIYDVATRDTNLYLAMSLGATPNDASAATTVTNNGSLTTYPRLEIKRSGGTSAVVKWLKNVTTDKTVWLNYSLLAGETLVIDFKPGAKSITSDFFGNVIGRALLPNSDFASFGLQPGDNTISLYIDDAGTPTLTVNLIWREAYWSVDGAA